MSKGSKRRQAKSTQYEENYDAIFKSFVTFKDGGTGLGLSITRKIIMRLGGRISVGRSDLGGARFTVSLPDKERES